MKIILSLDKFTLGKIIIIDKNSFEDTKAAGYKDSKLFSIQPFALSIHLSSKWIKPHSKIIKSLSRYSKYFLRAPYYKKRKLYCNSFCPSVCYRRKAGLSSACTDLLTRWKMYCIKSQTVGWNTLPIEMLTKRSFAWQYWFITGISMLHAFINLKNFVLTYILYYYEYA